MIMPGSNRINVGALFCSCTVQGVLIGGLLWGIAAHRTPRAIAESRPLVIEMIPLEDSGEATSSAPLPSAAPAGAMANRPPHVEPSRPVPVPGIPASRPGAGPAIADAGILPSKASVTGDAGPASGAAASLLTDYQRRLNALVAQNMRYPPDAVRRRLAGVTQLAFSVARDGAVIDSWIERSSGSTLLDTAALDALDRAEPLPPIPGGLPDPLGFVVEIDASTVLGASR